MHILDVVPGLGEVTEVADDVILAAKEAIDTLRQVFGQLKSDILDPVMRILDDVKTGLADIRTVVQVAGLVTAFAGVAWAFSEGFSQPAAGPHQWLGDALGVAAGILWGATTLAIRGSRLAAASAEKTLLYQLAISGVALSAAALVAGQPLAPRLSALTWASLFFQIVVVTFASYLLWFWLIRHYPATRLASFTLLTPVFGLLLGALLLGEPITARLVVALLAVALGIVVVNRR